MGKGLFVVGTDTDVGKTFVTAGIVYTLKKCTESVVPYKPIQSGCRVEDGNLVPTDIEFVKQICGLSEPYSIMNTYGFECAVSPHLAEELSDEAVLIEEKRIVMHYDELVSSYEYTVVEGAGGVIVPLTRQYYLYELIKALNAAVVLVTRPGVGTINHTALTVSFLEAQGIEVTGIIMNNCTGAFYEEDNRRVIKSVTGIQNILVLERCEDRDIDAIKACYDKCFSSVAIGDLFGVCLKEVE